MLKEDYNISITGIQSLDGESDKINLNTVGSYTTRGNIRYIAYNEYDPENPETAHTSILKIENECMTVISPGSSTRLILEKGIRHRCCYDSGFGALTLGIFTSSFSSDLNDGGGKLNVKYTLDIDSSLSSCNEITVDVRKRPDCV